MIALRARRWNAEAGFPAPLFTPAAGTVLIVRAALTVLIVRTALASAAGTVAGGTTERTLNGKPTTVKDVVVEGAVGLAAGPTGIAVSKVVGGVAKATISAVQGVRSSAAKLGSEAARRGRAFVNLAPTEAIGAPRFFLQVRFSGSPIAGL